ncbi:MAG: mechanosensitive ion channel family protein, partial [Candidatus Binatia bacterium]
MENIVESSVDVSVRTWELFLRLSERLVTWVATSGARIVLILALAWVSIVVLRRSLAYLHRLFGGQEASLERMKRADTLTGIIRAITLIFVTAVSAMMVLKEIGIDIAPILATAGIGGLAVGFGAQSLVKDVISGFFLLVEDQVRIGDIVEIAGRGGVVEKISLRTIVLRDLAGAVHTIPNGSIDVIKNMTKDYSRYVFDVGIAYREDTDEVVRVLVDLMEEMRREESFRDSILEPLEVLGVDELAESAVVIKARVMTRPAAQW